MATGTIGGRAHPSARLLRAYADLKLDLGVTVHHLSLQVIDTRDAMDQGSEGTTHAPTRHQRDEPRGVPASPASPASSASGQCHAQTGASLIEMFAQRD